MSEAEYDEVFATNTKGAFFHASEGDPIVE
jgi:hypothetical protein